jgi:integrase
MFFAGLRPGEARGARWQDYDGKTLSVKQSVWRKHTTDPKTAGAAKPVLVIEPLRELLAELLESEGNPANGPILRGTKGGPLDLNMLAKRVIRPALRNPLNYRDPETKPSSVNTTLAHYIKDVPEVTANGMALVEQLFGKLDDGEQVVQ